MRLTADRRSGIKTGYWSPAKKEELVQRLGRYEDCGLEPEELMALVRGYDPRQQLPPEDELLLVEASGQPAENVVFDHAFELAVYSEERWMLEHWPEWEAPSISRWWRLP